MKKSWIVGITTAVLLGSSNIAMALEKVHVNPAHHGPGWLASFAAVCGVILSVASLALMYMIVSGKAGKYTE